MADKARSSIVPHPTEKDKTLTLYDGFSLSDGTVVQLDAAKEVRRLTDVWNIPLIAGDRTHVEHRLQKHFQFDVEPLINLEGVLSESRMGFSTSFSLFFTRAEIRTRMGHFGTENTIPAEIFPMTPSS
jgi:hypothetical protein